MTVITAEFTTPQGVSWAPLIPAIFQWKISVEDVIPLSSRWVMPVGTCLMPLYATGVYHFVQRQTNHHIDGPGLAEFVLGSKLALLLSCVIPLGFIVSPAEGTITGVIHTAITPRTLILGVSIPDRNRSTSLSLCGQEDEIVTFCRGLGRL